MNLEPSNTEGINPQNLAVGTYARAVSESDRGLVTVEGHTTATGDYMIHLGSDRTAFDPVQEVKPFRHPYIHGDMIHAKCERRFHDHGWIDYGDHGFTVCPWDWDKPTLIDPWSIREGERVRRVRTDTKSGVVETYESVVVAVDTAEKRIDMKNRTFSFGSIFEGIVIEWFLVSEAPAQEFQEEEKAMQDASNEPQWTADPRGLPPVLRSPNGFRLWGLDKDGTYHGFTPGELEELHGPLIPFWSDTPLTPIAPADIEAGMKVRRVWHRDGILLTAEGVVRAVENGHIINVNGWQYIGENCEWFLIEDAPDPDEQLVEEVIGASTEQEARELIAMLREQGEARR